MFLFRAPEAQIKNIWKLTRCNYASAFLFYVNLFLDGSGRGLFSPRSDYFKVMLGIDKIF